MIERLQENFEPHPWQIFRDQLLWTREVNLILDANKVGIMAIYKRYSHKKQLKVTYASAMRLMTSDTSIKLLEKDAKICYAMCLQTCAYIVK